MELKCRRRSGISGEWNRAKSNEPRLLQLAVGSEQTSRGALQDWDSTNELSSSSWHRAPPPSAGTLVKESLKIVKTRAVHLCLRCAIMRQRSPELRIRSGSQRNWRHLPTKVELAWPVQGMGTGHLGATNLNLTLSLVIALFCGKMVGVAHCPHVAHLLGPSGAWEHRPPWHPEYGASQKGPLINFRPHGTTAVNGRFTIRIL